MANIADLEATLRLIAPSDAERVLAPIRQATAEYERFERIIERTNKNAIPVSPQVSAYRADFIETARIFQGMLDTASRKISNMAAAYQQAGIPLANLNSLTGALQLKAENTAKAIQQLATDFSKASRVGTQGPAFSLGRNDGLFQLNVSRDSALTRAINAAWYSTTSLDEALKAAERTAQKLLTSQTANSSVENNFRRQSSHVYSAQRSLEDYEKVVQRVQQSITAFTTTSGDSVHQFRATVSAVSRNVAFLFGEMEAKANSAAAAILKAATTAQAAGGGTAVRASPEAMAARRAAQVELEEQRRQTALLIETERRQQEMARLAAAATLDQARAAAAANRAEAERVNSIQTLNRAQERANRLAQEAAAAAAQAATPWGRFAGALQNIGSWSGALSGPLAALAGRFITLQQAVSSSSVGIAAWGVAMSAGVTGVRSMFNEMVRVERIMGPVRELHMAIARVAGEDGVKNFNELTAVMVKYGLSIEHLSKPIARLKIATEGTILGGDKFRGFLEDFAAVGTKFALPQEAMAGMAKAFEQMISKGTVQAEEFRQQLGDRLPAAARIGLLTFRELTGNAQASFEDFMNAMKNRQIESTRFLDIFMKKIKETFNIDNSATDNLNAAYGRLAASKDVLINKLDQSMGVTKSWMGMLNGVSAVLGTLGNNAEITGAIISTALGVIAVRGVMALSGALLGASSIFAGVTVGLAGMGAALLGVKVALAGVAAAMAYMFGRQLYDLVVGGTGSAMSEAKKLVVAEGASISDMARAAVAAGGAMTAANFKVKFDDEVSKSFSNPSNLIAEINRYFAHVREGLRTGTKIKIDFDFTSAIDSAIEDIQRKIGARGILTEVLKKDGTSRAVREFTRMFEETFDTSMDGTERRIITRSQNLTARLHKGASEALNQSILKMEDLYAAADSASQLVSARQAARQIKDGTDQINRLNQLKSEYRKLQEEMAKIQEVMTPKPGGGPLDMMLNAAKSAAPILQGLAATLGLIAAVNMAGLVFGIQNVAGAVANAIPLLNTKLGKLTAIVAVAGAIGLMANSGKALADSIDSLESRSIKLKEEISLRGTNFTGWTRLGEVLGDAKQRAQLLEQQLVTLRQEQDAAARGVLTSRMGSLNGAGILGGAQDKLREMFNLQTPADYARAIEYVNQQLGKTRRIVDDLSPTMDAYQRELRRAQQQLTDEATEQESVRAAHDKLKVSLDELAGRRRAFNAGGAEALKFYDTEQQLWKQIYGGVMSYVEAMRSADPEVQKLLAGVRSLATQEIQFAAATARATNEGHKFARMTKEQADGIIQQADAIMEGFGKKTGAALRDITKKVDDYTTALRVNGVASEEAKQKGMEFAEALKMQAAGINFAALQFKPYEALQNNFMKFTDSLVDLFGKGELNAKNFKKAFGDMALSIASDMLKMIIKANILRPLMQSIWNMGGSGFMGGTAGMGMSNPFGSLFGFAKGGIFDRPVGLSMPGGASGVMAEAGPEAVMPLRRGPDGSLGIQVMGGSGGGGSTYNVTYNVSTPDVGGFRQSENQMAAMFSRMADRGRRNT